MNITLPDELKGYEYDPLNRIWVRRKAIFIPKITLAEVHLRFCPEHGDRDSFLDAEGSWIFHGLNSTTCHGDWQLASPAHINRSRYIIDYTEGGDRQLHHNPNYTGALK